MFRLFGKKDKEPTPSWMKWLILGFVAYALITGMQKDKSGAPNRVRESFNETVTNLNPHKFFNFADFKQAVFPSLEGSLHIKDTAEGTGNPAICGQEAAIAYESSMADGKKLTDAASKESPKRFRIGTGTVIPAFEQGVIGMKAGGKRTVLAPPPLAYGVKGFARDDVPLGAPVRFDIELLEITPTLPDFAKTSYRILPLANGLGTPIICGQPGKFHVTVWDVDGKKLYSSRDNSGAPLAFTPGKGEVFSGLEQGVVGMAQNNASRTLIVPPDFQKTMSGGTPTIDITLPGKTVLVDVESIPLTEPAKAPPPSQ